MSETLASAALGRLMELWRRLALRPRLVLALFCLALWTPGALTLPPLDRDESRFAQASKQMLESGNYIDIRFGAVPRYQKPVGIYWLQAATTAIAGQGEKDHIWTYRLPSLIGAVAAVWLAFWCARAFVSAEAALLAAALLGATVLLAGEATIATTDAVLLACVLGAQGHLLRVYQAARTEGAIAPGLALALAGWVAFAAGILIKGPVIVGVCAFTVLALVLWDRDWHWLGGTRPLMGLALTLVLVLPWFVAIWLQSRGQFYQQSFGHDFAAKLAGGQESHGAPPGYFLVLASLTFWPAILFLLPGLGAAIRKRAEPAIRFLLAWIASWWIVVELVPTKLPQYILPVYPALAMLAALWAWGAQDDKSRWDRVLFYAAVVQFALGIAAFVAVPLVLPGLYGQGVAWWLIAPVSVGAALAAGALIAFLKRAKLAAGACAFAAALVFYPTLTLGTAPLLDQLWVSPRAAAAAKALARPGDPPPVLAGYIEPSLVFLLGSDTLLTNGQNAAEAGAAQGGLALIEDRQWSSFMTGLAWREADAREVGAVSGIDYSSRGRRVHIRIYRVTPTHEETLPPLE